MPEPDLLERTSYSRTPATTTDRVEARHSEQVVAPISAPQDVPFAPPDVPSAPPAVPPAPPASARPGVPHTERADDPAGRARPRVRLLDGFRLLAALMVVCWHYSGLTHGNGQPSADIRSLHPFAAYGWLGVELFFLISGFVIAMSAVNRSVGEFAVSRFVRLFPAYWLGVLVTAVVLLIWPIAVHPPKLSDIGVNLTMLQEGFRVPSVDAVYWTLFAELRFYLLFAFVVWRGVTYARAVGFSVIWLAASALTYSSHGLIHTLVMPDWAPFFVAGLAFFLMHRYGSNLLLWTIVAATFLLGQRQALNSNNFHLMGQPMPAWPVVAILAGFYLLVAAVALGWLRANWRWLTVAGVLTYPLYLLHEYIGWTVFAEFRGRVDDGVLFLAVVAGMLGAAWLVHRYVEKPVAAWLRRRLATGLACGAARLRPAATAARGTDIDALPALPRQRTGKVKARDARSTG